MCMFKIHYTNIYVWDDQRITFYKRQKKEQKHSTCLSVHYYFWFLREFRVNCIWNSEWIVHRPKVLNTCLCPPSEMSGRFFSSSACYFPCPKHLIWQISSCQFFLCSFEMQIIFKNLLPLIALHCLFQDLEPYILNGIIKAGRASSLRPYSRVGLTSICSML